MPKVLQTDTETVRLSRNRAYSPRALKPFPHRPKSQHSLMKTNMWWVQTVFQSTSKSEDRLQVQCSLCDCAQVNSVRAYVLKRRRTDLHKPGSTHAAVALQSQHLTLGLQTAQCIPCLYLLGPKVLTVMYQIWPYKVPKATVCIVLVYLCTWSPLVSCSIPGNHKPPDLPKVLN